MLNHFIDTLSENNSLLQIILAITVSAVTSYYVFPIIIQTAKFKDLISNPNFRSVHVNKISNLGGLGIFLGIAIVITFFGSQSQPDNLLCLLGSLIILLFTGLKDDLVGLSPKQKLIGQAIAVSCIIVFSDIRIHSLYGLFGIENLPYTISILFTLFVFVLIINAFNLIDGVDGLSGSIGIISSLFFGIYFYLTGSHYIMFLSFSIIGTLSSFLIFNFSKKNKIFMGDTGSMIIGFLLCYQATSFLTINQTVETTYHIQHPIVLVLSIFCFPLMDLVRVFIVRLRLKKSPFSADKNHIHHKLLLLGLKHWEIALTANVFSLLIVAFTYAFRSFDVNILFIILTLTVFAFAILPSYLYKRNKLVRPVFGISEIKEPNIIRNISA
jgi:UDP-N-acetylmuramyl pentapeptide phosphotransferase/UDP-N-acetylglucosamine-1-phosphate transferase